jgi:hypothetical protein
MSAFSKYRRLGLADRADGDSVVRAPVGRRPPTVSGHVEPVRHFLSPTRNIERLAPVVGDPHGLAVFDLGDRHIAVDGAVPVVGAPLDEQKVAEMAAFSNCKSELLEVPLDGADPVAAPDDLSHLRPFPNRVVCQRQPEDVGEPCRAIRNALDAVGLSE